MMMLSRAFRAHGSFCASHPWEVIVATMTLTCCMMSFSMFAGNPRVCGWNYKCENNDMKSSDVLILMITRCIAVTYIYLQFKNLRKLGSKYLIGIAGVVTVFSSFVFSTAVVHLIGSDLTGLNEALPFFLLLVDLSKACALARFALRGKTEEEVKQGIAQGMAVLGPNMTLDVLVETLVISIGTFSGIKQLDTMCCFGVLSVITNYLAFMTFYPACLAIVLDLSVVKASQSTIWSLTHILQEEPEEKANPVVQRVKVIMSAGLVMVHVHSRWLVEKPSAFLAPTSDHLTREIPHPELSLWRFYLSRLVDLNVDYTITLALALILAAKYVLYDKDEPQQGTKEVLPSTKEVQPNTKEAPPQPTGILKRSPDKEPDTLAVAMPTPPVDSVIEQEKTTLEPPGEDDGASEEHSHQASKFSVGEDSEEEGETRGVQTEDRGTQTSAEQSLSSLEGTEVGTRPARSLKECVTVMESDEGPAALTNDEVIQLVRSKHIPAYKLETALGDHERGVGIRRALVGASMPTGGSDAAADDTLNSRFAGLPYRGYDYSLVTGACCENVVGYMPIPVGVAGPLLLDGKEYQVPMATTEGCLVASTNRGCRALAMSGGVHSSVLADGMTRAPVVRLPDARRATLVKVWINDNFEAVKSAFDSTSRFARLLCCQVSQAGRLLFVRFVSSTGDAMGMNMVSKGSEKALNKVSEEFEDMEILSLSGNYCTDKKPSAVNWIEGRGKSVVCEAVIPSDVVKKVLKTEVHALLDLNINKNLIGSAMAGSVGGFNAHSANMVAAIFIACGQDPAQVVSSSNCLTQMEACGPEGAESLRISCTMPSVEVGTVGGGTALGPQAACLSLLGVRGACAEEPGRNAATLARVVCGAVLAGELSLMSALAAGHLVRSHMKYNRSSATMVPSKTLGCGKE